jgi:hypothetical protein
MQSDKFALLQSDRHSATWKRLEAHYQGRLDMLRRRNDGQLNHEQTERLRGQIFEVKQFLALGDDPAPLETDD